MSNYRGQGRKKAVIDWNYVDRMLEAGADGVEIAARIGIHPETLYNACQRNHKVVFSVYAAQKRASGDVLLRVKQFEWAMKGNTTMLIWLGKNRLGQSDRVHHSGINPFADLLKNLNDQDLAELERIAAGVAAKPGTDPG